MVCMWSINPNPLQTVYILLLLIIFLLPVILPTLTTPWYSLILFHSMSSGDVGEEAKEREEDHRQLNLYFLNNFFLLQIIYFFKVKKFSSKNWMEGKGGDSQHFPPENKFFPSASFALYLFPIPFRSIIITITIEIFTSDSRKQFLHHSPQRAVMRSLDNWKRFISS